MQIHEQVQNGSTYYSFIMGRVPILQTNLLLMGRGSGFQNVFGLYFQIPEGQNPPAVHQITWTCSSTPELNTCKTELNVYKDIMYTG